MPRVSVPLIVTFYPTPADTEHTVRTRARLNRELPNIARLTIRILAELGYNPANYTLSIMDVRTHAIVRDRLVRTTLPA